MNTIKKALENKNDQEKGRTALSSQTGTKTIGGSLGIGQKGAAGLQALSSQFKTQQSDAPSAVGTKSKNYVTPFGVDVLDGMYQNFVRTLGSIQTRGKNLNPIEDAYDAVSRYAQTVQQSAKVNALSPAGKNPMEIGQREFMRIAQDTVYKYMYAGWSGSEIKSELEKEGYKNQATLNAEKDQRAQDAAAAMGWTAQTASPAPDGFLEFYGNLPKYARQVAENGVDSLDEKYRDYWEDFSGEDNEWIYDDLIGRRISPETEERLKAYGEEKIRAQAAEAPEKTPAEQAAEFLRGQNPYMALGQESAREAGNYQEFYKNLPQIAQQVKQSGVMSLPEKYQDAWLEFVNADENAWLYEELNPGGELSEEAMARLAAYGTEQEEKLNDVTRIYQTSPELSAKGRFLLEQYRNTLEGAKEYYNESIGTENEEAARDHLYFVEKETKYADISSRPDFEEKAKASPDYASDREYAKVNDLPEAQKMQEILPLPSGPMPNLGPINDIQRLTQGLTDEERKIYNYLYATEGVKAAGEYLDYMQYALSARQMQQFDENMQNLGKSGFGGALLATGLHVPLNMLRGLGTLDIYKQALQNAVGSDYRPINYNSAMNLYGRAADAATQGVNESVDWNIDLPFIGQVDAFDTLYNVVVSGLDSAAMGKVGRSVGGLIGNPKAAEWTGKTVTNLLIGSGAAQSTMQDIHSRGGNSTQAILGGTLAGVYEALFEDLSIDKFYDEAAHLGKRSFTEALKNIGAQAGINFTEEALTEAANIATDEAIMGDKSEAEASFKEYIRLGMTEEEARAQVAHDMAVRVLNSGFTGALMGAGFGAASNISSDVNTGRADRSTGKTISRQTMVDLKEVGESLGSGKAYELAKKYDPAKAGARETGELMREVAGRLPKEMRRTLQGSVARDVGIRMVQLGAEEDSAPAAMAIAKAMSGEELDQSDVQALAKSEAGMGIVKEVLGLKEAHTPARDAREEALNEPDAGTAAAAIDDTPWEEMPGSEPEEKPAGTPVSSLAQEVTLEEGTSGEAAQAARTRSGPEGDATREAASGMGEEARASGEAAQAARTDDEGTVIIRNEKGEETDVQDLDVPEEERALIRESADLPRDAQEAMRKSYDKESGDVETFSRGFHRVYDAASRGTPPERIKSIYAGTLTSAQRAAAISAGMAEYKRSQTTTAQAAAESGFRALTEAKGDEGGLFFANVKRKVTDTARKTQLKLIDAFAKETGIQVRLHDTMEENGNYEAGSNIVNLALDAEDNGLTRTVSHEGFHFIEQWSPEMAEKLKNFVIETLKKTAGYDLESRIRETQKQYTGATGKKMDRPGAESEIAAQSMLDVIGTEENLRKLFKADRTLGEKIGEWIKKTAERLRGLISRYAARSPEARALMGQAEYLEKIGAMYDAAIRAAGENYRMAQAGSSEAARENEAVQAYQDGMQNAAADEDARAELDGMLSALFAQTEKNWISQHADEYEEGLERFKEALRSYKEDGIALSVALERQGLPVPDSEYFPALSYAAEQIKGMNDGQNGRALEADLNESDGEETHYGDNKKFSVRVKDQKELDFLENQDTITTYKTMQLVDGKLYPPMAAVVAGSMEDSSELGQWEKATEHPELIKNGNKFTLNKGRGKGSLDAAYNPYMHSSNLMINDQFSGAYNRPELVTVECKVPVSESTSGYHAEFAKDSVGWHSWHTGTVAGQLRQQKGEERKVFLSRWIKPVRIVSDAEVAQHYAQLLEGTDIQVPDNVVSPSLLEALKKVGVPIRKSGKVKYNLRSENGTNVVDTQSIKDQYPSSAIKIDQFHTPEQIATIESYLGAVDSRLLKAAEIYKQNKNASFMRISLSDVTKKQAEEIKRITGYEVEGYKHDVDRNFFIHTEDRHGENGKQDRSMENLNDVARIGWVIENYDQIERATDQKTHGNAESYGYLDKNKNPMPIIRYIKRIDGTLYITEAVGENAWKKLHVISAYMKKAPANTDSQGIAVTRMPHADNSLGQYVQNAYASPDNASITRPEENVKRTFNLRHEEQPGVKDENGETLTGILPGGTVTKYSLRSWEGTDIGKIRRELINQGFTREEADKWINDVNSIAAVIAADAVRLDYDVTDPEKSMVKPNADYGASIDASTLCAKRLLYQGTFDAIQHRLPNTPLLPGDLIKLANMMREMGYETPCGICYVESRRRILGQAANDWLKDYKGAYKPKLEELTTSDGLERLRNEHPQAFDDFLSAMNRLNQRNPKVVQLRTDYRGEIANMSDAAVQKAINHGGLRVQSFSDFEIPHLIDMMQVVLDMASKGLTSQAYTKVPAFAWVFGDTGMKINLSLIIKGLDENGNLVFDNVEGMPFEEAMRIRNRYSKDVGTIVVGRDRETILAAMADDRVDFIIPFHRSGWTKKERILMETLKGYKDFTNDQNERKILRRKANGKGYTTIPAAKSHIKNFEPVGERKANGKGWDGYWDFSKSGKENAETYLRMCKEDGRIPKFSQFLVDNGDGSFSLQPDGSTDGYWKTLIDFKMYDNEGKGARQRSVTPNFNMAEAERVMNEYSLDRNGVHRESNNELPVAQSVVTRFLNEYKKEHPGKKYNLRTTDQSQQMAEGVREDAELYAQVQTDEDARAALQLIHQLYRATTEGGADAALQKGAWQKRLPEIAQKILDQTGSKYGKIKLEKALGRLFSAMDDNGYSVGEMVTYARRLAMDVLEEAPGVLVEETEAQKEIKRILRESRFYLTEDQKAEIRGTMGSVADFQRKNFGKLGIRAQAKDGRPGARMSLAELWQSELNAIDPGTFAADTIEADMPGIIDAWLETANRKMFDGTFGANIGQQATDMGLNMILDFYDVPGALKSKQEIREEFRGKVMKMRAEYQQKYTDRITKAREGKAATERKNKLRGQIGRDIRSINTLNVRGTDARHVPEELRGMALAMVKPFLNSTGVFTRAQIEALSGEYARLASRKGEIRGYDEEIEGKLEYLAEQMDGKRLSQLTEEQLQQLADVVGNLKKMIVDANEAFLQGRKTTVDALSEQLKTDMREKKRASQGKAAAALRSLSYKETTPTYYADRVGGIIKEMIGELYAGQNKWAFWMKAAKDKADALEEQYHVKDWLHDKKHLRFETVRGETIELDRGQALSLYATWKREITNKEQNANHLRIGGFMYEKGTNYKGVDTLSPHPLTEADMDQIRNYLGKEQMAFADAMVEYLSTDMAKIGNEVSMRLYGWEKFKESYYFPYKSDSHYLVGELTQTEQQVKQPKSMGSAKQLMKNASNPVTIRDFLDVWAGHVNEMAIYGAFAESIDTMNRVLNDRTAGEIHVDSATGKETVTSPESNWMEMERALGEEGVNYLKTLARDVSGGVRADERGFAAKGLSAFKKASVAGNLSVVLQQPTAIARAFMMLSPRYAITNPLKLARNIRNMYKYSGVANIKEMGRFDTGTGKSAVEWLKGNLASENAGQRLLARLDTVFGIGAEKADEWTWGMLWGMVESEVSHRTTLESGTEEFYRAVAERFEEIVNHTQVYDSVLSRSEWMRSNTIMDKMATSFMAEPTLTVNMLQDALMNFKEKGGKGRAVRALGCFVMNSLLVSLAKSFITAARRKKDEGRTYLEKYLAEAAGNFSEEISPYGIAGLVPWARDAVSIFEGYDVSRSDMDAVTKIFKAWETVNNENATLEDKIQEITGAAGYILGVPSKNIWRDAEALIRNIFLEESRPLSETSARDIGYSVLDSLNYGPFEIWDESKTAYYQRALEALKRGDESEYRELMGYVMDARKTQQKTASSGLKAQLKLQVQEGTITEEQAEKIMKEQLNMDAEDAYYQLKEWKSGDESWRKYGELFDAIESGKNLQAVVRDYTSHGVEAGTLDSQITSQYKPQYVQLMQKGDRVAAANLKAKILAAYVALGYDRDKKNKDIDAWLKQR